MPELFNEDAFYDEQMARLEAAGLSPAQRVAVYASCHEPFAELCQTCPLIGFPNVEWSLDQAINLLGILKEVR